MDWLAFILTYLDRHGRMYLDKKNYINELATCHGWVDIVVFASCQSQKEEQVSLSLKHNNTTYCLKQTKNYTTIKMILILHNRMVPSNPFHPHPPVHISSHWKHPIHCAGVWFLHEAAQLCQFSADIQPELPRHTLHLAPRHLMLQTRTCNREGQWHMWCKN